MRATASARDISAVTSAYALGGTDNGCGFALLDDRGSLNFVAVLERVAVVHRGFEFAFLKPAAAVALHLGSGVASSGGAGQRQLGSRARHPDTEIDCFKPRPLKRLGIAGGIGANEGFTDCGQVGLAEFGSGQRHRDIMHLADKAHVRTALDYRVCAAGAGTLQMAQAFLLQFVQQRVHRVRVKTQSQFDAQRPDILERQRSGQEPQRRSGTRGRRDQNRADAHGARHIDRMGRACAAKANH